MKIIFYLPWPPTVNNYYSCTKYGIHISKRGRKYADDVASAVREQLGGLKIHEHVELTVILYPPDKRTRDLDNHMKALQDALTKCELWEDDAQIDQLRVFRGEILRGGKVACMVRNAGMVIPEMLEDIVFESNLIQ